MVSAVGLAQAFTTHLQNKENKPLFKNIESLNSLIKKILPLDQRQLPSEEALIRLFIETIDIHPKWAKRILSDAFKNDYFCNNGVKTEATLFLEGVCNEPQGLKAISKNLLKVLKYSNNEEIENIIHHLNEISDIKSPGIERYIPKLKSKIRDGILKEPLNLADATFISGYLENVFQCEKQIKDENLLSEFNRYRNNKLVQIRMHINQLPPNRRTEYISNFLKLDKNITDPFWFDFPDQWIIDMLHEWKFNHPDQIKASELIEELVESELLSEGVRQKLAPSST